MLTRKLLATIYGIVFLLVGLLGFISNPVLGLFSVNLLHNLIHIVSGLAGLLYGARSDESAALYGKVFGVVYALVTVLGFILVPNSGDLLGLVTINSADNWLHLVLTIGFFVIAFAPLGTSMAPAKKM